MSAILAQVPPVIFAHFGHWYVELLFLAPFLGLVGFLCFQSWRENRKARQRGPASRG